MLEEVVGVLSHTACHRFVRSQRTVAEFGQSFTVDKRSEVFVVQLFDFLDFVRSTESVEEVYERNTRLDGSQMSDAWFSGCAFRSVAWGGLQGRSALVQPFGKAERCEFRYNEFSGMTLTRFDFSSCRFGDCTFDDCKLAGADFRGVPLGSVTRIALEARPGEAGPTIPVYVQLRDGAIEWAGGTPNAELQRETFRRMIQGGLRARLQMQSLVTGQFRIELDFAPGTEAVYRSSTPDLEIPTLPSPIDQLQKRLARLPLADMVASADVILRSLATTLGSGKLDTTLETVTGAFAGMQATFARLDSVLAEARLATQRLNTTLGSASAELPQALESFRLAMENVERTTRTAGAALHPASPLMEDMRRMLREATAAMRSLRSVADTIERNPEALIYGKQGQRR